MKIYGQARKVVLELAVCRQCFHDGNFFAVQALYRPNKRHIVPGHDDQRIGNIGFGVDEKFLTFRGFRHRRENIYFTGLPHFQRALEGDSKDRFHTYAEALS